jgi:hypothetical protein
MKPRAYHLLAPLTLLVAGCPKDNPPTPQPAADAATTVTSVQTPADTKHLEETAKKVLGEIEALETTKDVVCWTSFRQLDNFISSKEYSHFGALAKITATKALVRGAWEKASRSGAGAEITADDLKKAVPLTEQNMTDAQKDKLAAFAKDLGMKAYKDYRTTSEHFRVILAVIQDELIAQGDPPLKPLAADGLTQLAELTTRLSLALMQKAGAAAQDERTPYIEAAHVKKAKEELSKQFDLRNATRSPKVLSADETKAKLAPLTLKLIQGKVKALQTYNKDSKDLTADVNKLAKMPVTAEAIEVWKKDLQSFVHFVAAGYEPMQADNFLSDGQFAEAKLPTKAYVDDVSAHNAIMQLFPHFIMPNGDIKLRYEPNPAHPSKTKGRKPIDVLIKDYDQNGIRDSAVHWIALEAVHKEKAFAMDPFAAEFLSEIVSVMFTHYMRRGEEIAKEAKAKEVTAEHAKKVRDKDYVMVMPKGEQEQIAWTPEQQKKKDALLAKYPKELFKDVTKASGLPADFPKLPEVQQADHGIQKVMGSGVAVGDVNKDGYPDLYVGGEGFCRLYLNKGKDGPGKFTDGTEAAGLPKLDDCKQPLFFDMDGDGDLDLLVLRSEAPSLLFRNDNGKFVEVSKDLGFVTSKGAHVATVFDYDGDGDLDIYVGYYGADANNRQNFQGRNLPSMDGRNGTPHQLFKRGPDGKYTDVAKQAGVDDTGWTLAVSMFDANNDGKPDMFLANDFGEDVFYLNKGDGTFENIARVTGTDDRGSGMNVSFTDVNGDGYLDFYVSNIDMFSKNIKVIYPTDKVTLPNFDEALAKSFQYLSGNKLFVNPGADPKKPWEAKQGMYFEPGDRGWGWAAVFFDYENDGDDDMYFSNGWIDGSTSHNQKNQMFLQDAGFFYLANPNSPEAFPGDSRSVVAFDMDGDGDLDLLVNNFRQPLVLLENTQSMKNHWVKVRLKGAGLNTQAIGARITAKAGDKKILREVNCGTGYMGQNEDVVTIGVGQATKVELTIRWPDGKTQTIPDVEVDKLREIKQGEASAAK